MVMSPSNCNVAAINAATPIGDFMLRGGGYRVDDPRDLARRRQRDRWRAELSSLRGIDVTHLLVAVTSLALWLVTYIPIAPAAPVAALVVSSIIFGPTLLFSSNKLFRNWRRAVELERRLDEGGRGSRGRRYQKRRASCLPGWGWLPPEFRALICLLVMVGAPAVSLWLGYLGRDLPKGGVGGIMILFACIGLPGIAFGLACWPRDKRRRA